MSTLLKDLSAETSALVEASRAAVVCILPEEAHPRTGVVIADDEIMTIARSAEPGEKVPVHGPGGKVEATVVGFDPYSGLALLRTAGGSMTPAKTATASPKVGELAVTVSCPIPDGHEARLSMIRCVGTATRLRGGRKIESYYQTDDARHRGFGGAVLFAASGEMLGLTMPTRHREESFILPVAEIMQIADQLRSGKTVGTGYLGVHTTAVELPVPADGHTLGLLITGVENDSPASKAGLTVGQFIVSVAGLATPTIAELHDSLSGLTDGETIAVVVANGTGKVETVNPKVVLR